MVVFLLFPSNSYEAEHSGIIQDEEGKIKVKVNYSENPNQLDFFTNNENIELSKYIDLGAIQKLEGFWSGTYYLDKGSIIWTNPNLNDSKIYNSIAFGPYTIHIRFNLIDGIRLSGVDIVQEDITYASINIELANDKQINYWTTASNKNWIEIIRGKIFRMNDNELFTVFQTTVYEGKTPIYAFRGEAILRR